MNKPDDLEIRLLPPGKRTRNGRRILSLAILGLFGCPIFGVCAWIWGRRELSRIRMGQGDPVEEGRVRAAMILGLLSMVHLFLAAGVLAAVAVIVASVVPDDFLKSLDLLRDLTRDGTR